VPDQTATTAERGREAEHPHHIPVRGWKDVLLRAWRASSERNLSLVAGGVTYYVLLSLFPALAALVSIYGLVADPKTVETEINSMSGILPGSSRSLISSELHSLVSSSSSALGIGVVIGIVIALYSASRGMTGLITALDIAYGEEERRSFIWFNLLALVLTIGMIVGGMVAIALVAGLPAVLSGASVGSTTKWVAYVVEWPVLIVFVMTALAVLYRYAPDRREPRWEWVSPGAVIATVLWVIGSILFAVYVSHFSDYNKTYGSLGAMIALLTWLWLSAYVVLLGAGVNAEAERQTRRDSTRLPEKPMGERGAFAADTLGPPQDQTKEQ
jgi:membrane protein